MDVRLPDGTIIQGVPDGTTKADLVQRLQRNGMAVPSEWLAAAPPPPSAAERAGGALKEVPRQLGLTGRYAMEGLGGLADVFTAPFRVGLNAAGVKNRPYADVAADFATGLGMPQPQGANERVIGDAARLVAGGGGMGAAARGSAALTQGVTRGVLQQLAANQGTQGISAATAGLAGGSTREAGGGPGAQFLASLLGGVAGGAGAGLAQSVGGNLAARGRALLTPDKPQAVEQQIELALRGSGTDWSALPERVRQAMRAEVAAALKTGDDLNPDAIRRLADFRQVPNTTPTRGMLTQDPGLITRERNLAKTGANSADLGLQRLPMLENRNTAALLSAIDDAGARNAPDAFSTGQRAIGALQGNIDASRARISGLYDQARDSAGRSAQLDGHAFTSRASQLLDENLLGGALPKSVETHLNRIAQGEVPFDVNYAEQLKTAMGKLQRASSDGQTRMALGVVRQALDATPLRGAGSGIPNPGNLPAVMSNGPQPASLGAESIQAFNRARQANAAFMSRVEGTPALRAVMDGVEPDRFVQQFITGSGASAADVRALARAAAANPEAMGAIKASIADHLKSAATNGTDDVVKWSSAAYNKALNNIGDRKLSAFFAPEEIAQLRAIGRVGTYMQAQPAGSAVNNSNSGALMLGRGLDWLTDKAPLGIDKVLQGVIRGQQQGAALNVPGALRAPQLPQSGGLLPRMGAAPALYGWPLLTGAEPIDQRQNGN